MKEREIRALDKRLESFLDEITGSMNRPQQRRWAKAYVQGLLLDGERKSMEPMAKKVGVSVQSLQQFIGQSTWPARELLGALNQVASRRLGAATYWIIDETSFPKQGTHSVGVAHQYCGARGKLDNCQVAVSLHGAKDNWSWPMGWELYLPREWVEDSQRRQRAGLPREVKYQTKLALAWALIEHALGQGLTPGIILADQLYGKSFAWRGLLHQKQLAYCVAADPKTGVWVEPASVPVRSRGRPAKNPPRDQQLSIAELALKVPWEQWQKLTWREGSKGPQTSRFYKQAVRASNRSQAASHPQRWTEQLVVEWPEGEKAPTKYWLCWMGEQKEASLLELVQHAKGRFRVEQDYRELKDELGLDHFEGRGWVGWHHHVAMVTTAFVFLRLEQQLPEHKKNRESDFAFTPPEAHSFSDPALRSLSLVPDSLPQFLLKVT